MNHRQLGKDGADSDGELERIEKILQHTPSGF